MGAQNATGLAGGLAAALSFGFERVTSLVKELSPEQLSAVPAGYKNSIATLAVHLAATEITFAHLIARRPIPDELRDAFMTDLPINPLPVATGETAESLVAKLEQARSILLEVLSGLSDEDIEGERTTPSGRVTSVKFLLSILPQHQGQHYGHMQYIKQQLG